MSYDLHITKAEHWIYREENPIGDEDVKKVSDLLDTYKGVPYLYQGGRFIVSGADEQKRFVESLGINNRIHHPKYGTGEIIDILGEGMDTEFVVKFTDRAKVKRLLAYYAPISR